MAAPDTYSAGSGGDGGGGNDWELVSLTASTYAAAPGPILPLLDADKTDSPPPAIFMSQHFNLPKGGVMDLLNQSDYCEGLSPAAMISCAKISERELDDGLTRSDFSDELKKTVPTLDDVLFADANGLRGGLDLAGEEEEQTTVFFSSPDAGLDIRGSALHVSGDAVTDGIVDSAHLSCLAAHVPVGSVAVSSGVACIAAKDQSKIPSEAWWKKTFSFLCNNAKESVTFRSIFVAATIVGLAILGQRENVQLEQLRLQFHVDSEKISCSVGEPLGQVKGNIIIGGSPVAQG